MIRFGVLGAGRIGKVHSRTIAANPKATLAYIADAVPAAAEALATQYGAGVASVEDIIKAKDVGAVLIGSPTGFHAEQIQAASNAGKAIMCEKPVSLDVGTIEETLRIVEKNKSTLMIGFNRRFDPNFRAVKTALDAGEVGKAELLSITSFDPAPPTTYLMSVRPDCSMACTTASMPLASCHTGSAASLMPRLITPMASFGICAICFAMLLRRRLKLRRAILCSPFAMAMPWPMLSPSTTTSVARLAVGIAAIPAPANMATQTARKTL